MLENTSLAPASLIVFCLLIFVAGCGDQLTQENYDSTETESASEEVAQDEYALIKAGMTFEEVEKILGPGEELASSTLDVPSQNIDFAGIASSQTFGMTTSSKVFNWEERNRIITVIFLNGEVISKSVVNLW